ncbi:MAG: hypothetical protein HS128_18145 [Ideonella sp.]|nr:hypothetical protein [Ideonella sp.]MCC7455613.1 hypothetical protein [Nitrospira sp.]
MFHPAPFALPVSRARWARAADALFDAVRATAGLPQRGWQAWVAARRRALEFAALRELSPAQLRDIGACDECIGEALYLRQRQVLLSRLDLYQGR